MALRRNILVTYASQAYMTLVSILTVPYYIRYMGSEAYGLVGFFVMLQSWFMLLDLGLTPTVARQTARFHGDAVPAQQFLSLIRALEALFAIVAVLGGAALWLGSGWLATNWLNARSLPLGQVQESLEIVAVIVALRWMGGIYRSVITGAERLVWLGNFTAAIATARFVGVIAVLKFVDARPTTFFWFQLLVAVIEFVGLLAFTWRLLPAATGRKSLREGFREAGHLIRFSMSLAFTASVWVFVTQSDKLILSKVLPLAEYGYFTLAALVAGGVTTLVTPISAALLPRMTRLEAEGRHQELVDLYRQSTQLVAVLALAIALTMALLAHPLLLAWTGNAPLADHAAPVLAWYAIGNAVMALSAFPYYLQYAKGDLRMHVVGNAIYVVLLVPLMVWAAQRWGGQGAGAVWLGVNALYLFAWTPWIHRRIEPTLNPPWYLRDILSLLAPVAVAGLAVSSLLPAHADRWLVFTDAILLLATMLVAGLACTSTAWQALAGARMPFMRGAHARRR
jgi:O-antigen/teichoic acid export membrane protein